MRNSTLNRYGSLAIGGSLFLLFAPSCSKKNSEDKAPAAKTAEPKAPSATPTAPKAKTEAETKAEAEAADKAANLKRIKDARTKLEGSIPVEAARWTDALKASAKTLAETDFKTANEALVAIVASGHRMPGNADRDTYRHPVETLVFLGLTPTSKVVEMGMGRGWYSEVIAPVVVKNGQFTSGTYDAEGPDDEMRTVYGLRQQAFLGRSEDLFGKIKTFDLGAETVKIGEPGSADLVLAIREMHNWQRRDTIDSNLKAVADVLAPGGTFGVVQHRAKPDAKAEESADKGYLPEEWLIAKIEAAGFKLVEKSDINANPNDTKDYEEGVWTLPPALTLGDVDKEKYKAIGESDRMTLRFEKVVAE